MVFPVSQKVPVVSGTASKQYTRYKVHHHDTNDLQTFSIIGNGPSWYFFLDKHYLLCVFACVCIPNQNRMIQIEDFSVL